MKTQQFLITIFGAASVAMAAPSNLVVKREGGSASKIVARQKYSYNDTGVVIMCTEKNWGGECTALDVPLAYDSCTTLSAPWAYNVSSLAPVPGVACWMRRSNNCNDGCRSPSGCNEIIEFPGYADLATYGPWNNTIGSFTCNPTNN